MTFGSWQDVIGTRKARKKTLADKNWRQKTDAKSDHWSQERPTQNVDIPVENLAISAVRSGLSLAFFSPAFSYPQFIN